jgi:tetratricopeptide (TPR) repeat protein
MSNNFCPSCGGPVKPESNFCPACGTALSGSKKSDNSRKSTFSTQFLILIGIIVVAAAAYLIFVPQRLSQPQKAAEEDFRHPQIPGMPAGTQAEFDKIVANLPKTYDSLVELGNHFMDNQVFPLAIECYARAINLNSTDANIHTDLGACYHSTGKNQEAIDSFEKAISLDPKHAIAHFNLGIVYRGMNDKEKARFYWNKFLELNPKSPLVDSVRAYLKALEV